MQCTVQLLQISCADVGYVHDYFFRFSTYMHTRNYDQSFIFFNLFFHFQFLKEHHLGECPLIVIEVHMVPSYSPELQNFLIEQFVGFRFSPLEKILPKFSSQT